MMPNTFTVKVIEGGMSGVALTGTEARPGRIPFAAIDRYAKRFGIEGEAFDLMLALFTPLDETYLAWEREQAEERARARQSGS